MPYMRNSDISRATTFCAANWISVKDRLPKEDVDVLVFCPERGIGKGYYDKNKVEFNVHNLGWVTP